MTITETDLLTRLFEALEEHLAQQCEMPDIYTCGNCRGLHYDLVDEQGAHVCVCAGDWMVVLRNCCISMSCMTRELCPHIMCTRCRDTIAGGRVRSYRGDLQIVSSDKLKG